jgi:hypothetical protein
VVIVDAPAQFAAQVAGHKGLGLAVFEVEKVRAVPTADLEDVAEPFRREQADPGALFLGDRIDDDGRAVHKGLKVLRADVGGCDDVHHALFELGRGRVALAGDDFAVRGHEHQVGEGPSNVCSDSQHSDTLSWCTPSSMVQSSLRCGDVFARCSQFLMSPKPYCSSSRQGMNSPGGGDS